MKARWDINRFVGFSLCAHVAILFLSSLFFSWGEKSRLVVVSTYSKVPTLFSFKPLTVKESITPKANILEPSVKKEQAQKPVQKKQEVSLPKQKSEIQKKAAAVTKKVEVPIKEVPKASVKKQDKPSVIAEPAKQKVEHKKAEEKPKAQEPAPVQKEVAKAPEVKHELSPQKLPEVQSKNNEASGQQKNQPVTQGEQSASVALQKELQREVDRIWAPPLGVPKGTECIVEVSLDKKGKVASFDLKRRSHILLFDMSVEEAAEKLTLGRSFWNRSFHITFRQ